MAENEECKICLKSEADNIPILNVITIEQFDNLTGITLGPQKVKKIYICKKCAREIQETMKIRDKIIKSLEERKTLAQAECAKFCALNSEPITLDISHEELIANLLRKEFVCLHCFGKIDHANKTCKKITASLKDFAAAKTPLKSEAAGNTRSPKTPKQKELTNETKNNDLAKIATTAARKLSTNVDLSLAVKLEAMNMK